MNTTEKTRAATSPDPASHPAVVEAGIRQIVLQFEERTLPRAEWTHAAHLAVGLVYVLDFGPERALDLLRERIQAYNRASGRTDRERNGYREDVTRCYVFRIADFVAATREYDFAQRLRMLIAAERR